LITCIIIIFFESTETKIRYQLSCKAVSHFFKTGRKTSEMLLSIRKGSCLRRLIRSKITSCSFPVGWRSNS
jgi:hypothetical protein